MSNTPLIKNPVMLALDVDTKEQAKLILDQVGSEIGAIKIGPRLGYQFGSEFIKECAAIAPVFIDNKYFDIPSTMVSAVKTSFQAGATFATVHALSGLEALSELAKLEKELNQIRPFKVLAVTILTSWDQQSMPQSLHAWPVSEHVISLANLVQESGLSGIVCSAHELELLKNHNLYKVTPGIRPKEASMDDQKRVMNPQQALRAGASALVIGRPILQSSNPKQAVLDILNSI